jgi:hypothetical protein
MADGCTVLWEMQYVSQDPVEGATLLDCLQVGLLALGPQSSQSIGPRPINSVI